MKVWIVEEDCIDPYFEAHVVGIFSTPEKAQKYLESLDTYHRTNSSIVEWDVDTVDGNPVEDLQKSEMN